jgi:catechol 2,3-dioxygenase-like lactoylglutathione lyase family enzyme
MESTQLIAGLDHVNLLIDDTPDSLERAHAFYGELLGLAPIERPRNTDSGRRGAWYQCGAQQLHLTTAPDASSFNYSSTRHPAFLVTNADTMRARLGRAGVEIIPGNTFPGQKRFFAVDPWVNRIEFVERTA